MFLTESEVNLRLSSTDNIVNRFGSSEFVKKKITLATRVNSETLSKEVKEEIMVDLAVSGETHKEISKNYGVTRECVSRIAEGNRIDGVNKERVERKVAETLAAGRDLALDKLMKSLNLISDDKLDKLTAKDLSTVTSNLSNTVSRLSPKETAQPNQVQVIIHAPVQKTEKDYQVVEI
jgi:adenine C2-methylase RlmN of 23S rRNA A2503 and tRNA A37